MFFVLIDSLAVCKFIQEKKWINRSVPRLVNSGGLSGWATACLVLAFVHRLYECINQQSVACKLTYLDSTEVRMNRIMTEMKKTH